MHPGQPAKVGKYEVERILGRGAMGVVYLARDPMIGRHIALKTIHLPAGLEPEKVHEFRSRFLREAQAAGRMNHPNIVTIYEADDGSAGGPPFIAMEYIQGDTWNARIKRGERAHPDQLLPEVIEVAEALSYAHRQDVVHRDIKPANIITTHDGRAKLMDFGIARVPTSELTHEGQFLGTPAYMSPEQVLGKPVDGRSDLFSLGTVIFEMITGLKPFAGEEVHTVTHKILQAPPEPLPERVPELPEPVAWILNHLMAKKPEQRYTNADQLVEDLRAYLHGALPPHAGQGEAAESTQVNGAAAAAPMAPPPEAPPKPTSPLSTLTEPPDAAQAPKVPAPASPPTDTPPTPPPPPKKGKGLWIVGAVTALLLLFAGAAGGGLWWWTHRGQPPGDVPEDPPTETGPVEPGMAPPPEVAPPPPSPTANPAERPAPKPKPTSAPPAATTSKPPAPVAPRPDPPTGSSRLNFTFTAGVLKGEYWLKVDGATVSHGVIDRKFTLKAGEWSGGASVPAGSHTVRFELKTEIQDLVTAHEERVDFTAGGARTLDVRLHKVRKELEFAWR